MGRLHVKYPLYPSSYLILEGCNGGEADVATSISELSDENYDNHNNINSDYNN